MKEINRKGFNFESKNEKVLLNVGTYEDGTALTEWEELSKDSRLAQAQSVRLHAKGGKETIRDWNERAPLFLKNLKHIVHFYVSHTWANAPENSPVEIEDPSLFFSPFPSLKTIHLEFVQFPIGLNFKLFELKKFFLGYSFSYQAKCVRSF